MNVPEHIAIIMDGNGRWAKQKGLPRNEGHRRGANALEDILSHASDIGVKHITAYAFSTENWNRPQKEVDGLMKIFEKYLDREIKKVNSKSHRFHVVGDMTSDIIPERIKEKVALLEDLTKDKEGLCFHMAFNYGGRDEIKRAVQKIAGDVKDGKLDIENITEALISDSLDTKGVPDPDLMIRTSGELRTSNYLPWQLTYAEFYFTDLFWPDFTPAELDKAIEAYNLRQRRFGKSE